MDIVIPYKKSSLNGLELRYALRGIEKYVSDRGNIFLVGESPDFVHNVIHIQNAVRPEKQFKAANIVSHLLCACRDKRVSDWFLFMADDHFLLKELAPNYNHRGTLLESADKFTNHQSYRATLFNTIAKLSDSSPDYGHGPMLFNKALFVRAMAQVDWTKPWGYAWKSLYCSLNGIKGEAQRDIKLKMQVNANYIFRLIKNQAYFSVDDRAWNTELVQVLMQLYPNPSQYEK